MNILHLRSSNFYGGPERQLHFHALKAKGSEFQISCGSFCEEGRTPEFLNIIAQDNIKTVTFNVTSAYDLQAVKLIKEYITSNKIDIICTHDYRTHFYGNMARNKKHTAWIAFSRGWTKDNLKVRLYSWFDKFIIRFADHIIAVSQAQKDKLSNIFISSKNITVALNAIEPSAFDNIDPIDLKVKFNLPKDSLIGISGGRFSFEKGQRYLVEAAKSAITKNNKLKFIFFGDGTDYHQIVDNIKSANLQESIICPGFEKNLIGHLKGADYLINPSLSEGLPNIVLEAMAMRIPTIATAVGGVPEMINDNQNGYLVPAGNAKALSEVIIKLASSMDKNNFITENAFKTIIEKFSFDAQYETIKIVYAKVKR